MLAGHLGATVGELRGRMGSRDFSEWQVYAARNPIGEDREDMRWAYLACEIANKSAYKTPPTAADFHRKMQFWTKTKRQTKQDQIAAYGSMKAAYGNQHRTPERNT